MKSDALETSPKKQENEEEEKVMTEVTREIVDFVTKATFNDLPEPVIHKTKQVIFDSIGCALGSYLVPTAKIVTEFVHDLGGKPQAAVIGDGKTSWALAAFANGDLISALDYDALGPIGGHTVAYVLPPCLAMGERMNASGRDLITAVAVGLETAGRVASSMAMTKILKDEPPYYESSPRQSFSSAVFGGVAGAGKLLGLDRERMANAFGIAGASTPVPATRKMEETGGPNMMTHYNAWPGWTSKLGTVAALLAERGYTGDTTILDGEWGFWKIYGSPFFKADNLLGGLGKEWHVQQMSFKRFPCCGVNHTSIQAINKIMADNHLKPQDVESILIAGDPMMLTPPREGNGIWSHVDTQYRNAYLAAVAVYHGDKPGPEWQAKSTYEDPRIRSLMERVKVEVHPKAKEFITNRVKAGILPIFWDVIVEFTAKGKKFTAEVSAIKGSAADPLTEDELNEKFRDNATFSTLTADKIESVIQATRELEKMDSVIKLMNLLT